MIHDPAVKCLLFLQLAVIKIRSQMIKQQSNSWLAVTQSSLDASGRNVVFPSNIIDSQDSREITHSHKANVSVWRAYSHMCVLLQKAGFKENMLVLPSVTQHEDRTCEDSTHFTAGDTNPVKLKQIEQMVGYQQHVSLFERKQQEKPFKVTIWEQNVQQRCPQKDLMWSSWNDDFSWSVATLFSMWGTSNH